MKYNVHLSSGAVISMNMGDGWRETIGPDGWLVDGDEVTVRIDAVVAIVPEMTAQPPWVRDGDGDGDLWTRQDDGTYNMHADREGWLARERRRHDGTLNS